MKKANKFKVGAEKPTKLIRSNIFSVKLLKEDQIIPLFGKLDKSLDKIIKVLLENIPSSREYFCEIMERLASGATLGKNFYDKNDNEDGNVKSKKEAILKPSEVRVLKKAFSLLNLRTDPKRFSKLVREVSFLRGILEESVEVFLNSIEGYAALVSNLQEAGKLNSIEYVRFERSIDNIHQTLGISNTATILRVIREVETEWATYIDTRTQIINPYLRKVFKTAKGFSTDDTQTLDNFQAGVFGLVRAIGNYTPHRFAHFSVVADTWIRQSILYYLKTEVNLIRLPMATWHYLKKIETAQKKLEQQLNREPTAKELAAETGLSIQKVKKTLENSLLVKIYSLDAPTLTEEGKESEGSWNRESVAEDYTPETVLFRDSEIDIIRKVICDFDSEEKTIFGLLSGCYEVVPDPEFSESELLQEKIRQKAAQYSLEVYFK